MEPVAVAAVVVAIGECPSVGAAVVVAARHLPLPLSPVRDFPPNLKVPKLLRQVRCLELVTACPPKPWLDVVDAVGPLSGNYRDLQIHLAAAVVAVVVAEAELAVLASY